MGKAQLSDRNSVIDIISESFQNNPSVLAVVKNDHKKAKRIKALASYAFDTAYTRNGVYLSTDRQGMAICYEYNFKKTSIGDLWNQVLLVYRAIGLSNVREVLKRDAFIKAKRPKSINFLYFWFLGVTDFGKGKTAAIELKNNLFGEAQLKGLSIYLETSVEKNKTVYERYGFEVYHTWKQENGKLLWFMRKPVEK